MTQQNEPEIKPSLISSVFSKKMSTSGASTSRRTDKPHNSTIPYMDDLPQKKPSQQLTTLNLDLEDIQEPLMDD